MESVFQRVAPLSQERIIRALKELGVVYFVDSTGGLGMFTNQCVVWFHLQGKDEESMMINADPFRDIPIEEIVPFRKFLNDWNANNFWPRVYPSINDEGEMRARCDHTINCAGGITDAQMETQILLFVTMIREFYQGLDDARKRGW